MSNIRLYHATPRRNLKSIIASGTIKGMWTPNKRYGRVASAKYWSNIRRLETGHSTVIIRANIPRSLLSQDTYGYWKPKPGKGINHRYVNAVWVWESVVGRWVQYPSISSALRRVRGNVKDL